MKATYFIVSALSLCILINGCANTGQDREEFVKGLVQKMTLDEKVGQMTQVDKRMLDSESDNNLMENLKKLDFQIKSKLAA